MTPTQMDALREIRRLLKEAYDDYFARGDGHCKWSEGAVEIHYPRYFDEGDPLKAIGIGIYSYVLGPGRMHLWWSGRGPSDDTTRYVRDRDPIEAALEDVREWHAEQLAWQPDGPDGEDFA